MAHGMRTRCRVWAGVCLRLSAQGACLSVMPQTLTSQTRARLGGVLSRSRSSIRRERARARRRAASESSVPRAGPSCASSWKRAAPSSWKRAEASAPVSIYQGHRHMHTHTQRQGDVCGRVVREGVCVRIAVACVAMGAFTVLEDAASGLRASKPTLAASGLPRFGRGRGWAIFGGRCECAAHSPRWPSGR